MDGVLAGFRLKRPHLSEIGQAVWLRFETRSFEPFSVRGGIQHFPADRANPGSDIS
jgi:hypothetical protein